MWTTASDVVGSGDGARRRMEARTHSDRLPRYGKGWPGSTASGVSTGRSVRRKYSSRNWCCASAISLGRRMRDALGGQERLDLLQEHPVLEGGQLVHRGRHGGDGLRGVHPVRRHRQVAGVELPLETGHADHEELVEVRAEDGQELHALEQGRGGVLGLLQHAAVELEPGQLPIDEAVVGHGSPISVEGFAQEEPVRHAARAHHEGLEAAQGHQLLDRR